MMLWWGAVQWRVKEFIFKMNDSFDNPLSKIEKKSKQKNNSGM